MICQHRATLPRRSRMASLPYRDSEAEFWWKNSSLGSVVPLVMFFWNHWQFGWQLSVRIVLWACSESRVSNIMPAVLVPATLQKRAECCPGRRLFKTKAQLNWDFGISYVWYTKCDNCAKDLTSRIWNLGEIEKSRISMIWKKVKFYFSTVFNFVCRFFC